jgi:type 1 glutamine amidotransferase
VRNLILTGGIRHDFDDNTAAVVELLADIGISCVQTTDMDRGIEQLGAESFDLVTIMALRWRMDGNPKYAALRNEFGYSIPHESRSTLIEYIRRGGGLFGLHTACLCFDDWDEWRDVLGGTWVWGRSFHPPLGPVSVSRGEQMHALTANLPVFDLVDEVYAGLDLASDTKPLLDACADDGTCAPVLWARRFGNGRVVFDALGHNRDSLQQVDHSRLIKRCAAWACGIPDDEVSAI